MAEQPDNLTRDTLNPPTSSGVEDDLTHYMNCCARQRERAEKAEAEVESYRRSPDGEARQVVADTIKKLKAERDLWEQRAEMAKNMLRETDAANERLRCAVAEIRAGKGRRPNPGYPDYVEAYDDWIVEVFDRWGV